MKTKFSIVFLLIMVLVTIVVPNHNFVTRIKVSLTLAELDISNSEDIHLLTVISGPTKLPLFVLMAKSQKIHTSALVIDYDNKINPTLNFLYLAHSPPTHS